MPIQRKRKKKRIQWAGGCGYSSHGFFHPHTCNSTLIDGSDAPTKGNLPSATPPHGRSSVLWLTAWNSDLSIQSGWKRWSCDAREWESFDREKKKRSRLLISAVVTEEAAEAKKWSWWMATVGEVWAAVRWWGWWGSSMYWVPWITISWIVVVVVESIMRVIDQWVVFSVQCSVLRHFTIAWCTQLRYCFQR